jgi:hypothetical protein
MGAVELIGVAASLSLLAGWRLYACIFAAGLAMRLGLLHLPQQIHALDVLANPWVIGIAALGAVAELFADKVMWLDSLWDAVHTLIRPLGGALLASAVIDASDPTWQVVVFLLGGGAAFLSHGAKAGARAVVNTSPEPVSQCGGERHGRRAEHRRAVAGADTPGDGDRGGGDAAGRRLGAGGAELASARTAAALAVAERLTRKGPRPGRVAGLTHQEEGPRPGRVAGLGARLGWERTDGRLRQDGGVGSSSGAAGGQ